MNLGWAAQDCPRCRAPWQRERLDRHEAEQSSGGGGGGDGRLDYSRGASQPRNLARRRRGLGAGGRGVEADWAEMWLRELVSICEGLDGSSVKKPGLRSRNPNGRVSIRDTQRVTILHALPLPHLQQDSQRPLHGLRLSAMGPLRPLRLLLLLGGHLPGLPHETSLCRGAAAPPRRPRRQEDRRVPPQAGRRQGGRDGTREGARAQPKERKGRAAAGGGQRPRGPEWRRRVFAEAPAAAQARS